MPKCKNYRNELEHLVYERCFGDVYNPLAVWVKENPNSLELMYSRIKYPDTATLQDMVLEFTTDVAISGDIVNFDAVVSCEIELEEELNRDRHSNSVSQWFRVSCSVKVDDKISNFKVLNIEPYSKGRLTRHEGKVDSNLVPKIYKKDLDGEATRFLTEFCPEALETPMAVPIVDIVKNKMGLNLVNGGRLTDNFSIFGQICFSAGKINVYDVFTGKENEIEVERGTVVIDSMTYWERNLGCVNNTVAHEAFHWYRHRVYATIRSILRNEEFIAHRCPAKSTWKLGSEEAKGDIWTDEKRMEWQATNIAPRILMPFLTVKPKIEELYKEYAFRENEIIPRDELLKEIITDLARFYKVSKQSAKIRMIELGYTEAREVYNYEDKVKYYTTISDDDAFNEYCNNEDFRKVIDSGRFRYVDGKYVVDDEKYINASYGGYTLRDYAHDNLNECALHFIQRKVDIRIHNIYHSAILSRGATIYEELSEYDGDKNISIIENAEELERKKEKFQKGYEGFRAVSQSFTFTEKVNALMRQKRWNSTIFKENTLLGDSEHSKIKNNNDKAWSFRTIMAICVGLDVNQIVAQQLLDAAEESIGTTQERHAYMFALANYGGDIFACNAFLDSVGVTPLGNRERRSKVDNYTLKTKK